MTRAERRIYPLHQETAWSMRNAIRSESHGFNTLGQPGYDATCALRHAARLRDPSNIIEYIREACRLKVHHPRRTWQCLGEPCNRAITHRADVAQFLGKNYVRSQLTHKRLVNCINCPVITQCAAHPLVDFATREASIVHWTMCDPWPGICFLRKVAFMRNTHHLFHQSERGHDLGCSRQKRNDPDHFLLYAVSCYEDRKRNPNSRTKKKRKSGRVKEFQISRIVGRRVPYNTPTACEISRTTIVREINTWIIARTFAQRASSGASVGPKVELCVKATNK